MDQEMIAPASRAKVIGLARQWIGTPYHHQASELGGGADCVGMVRGVWRQLYGAEPEKVPGYSRDWAEATGAETLIEAASRHLIAVEISRIQPGDVLIFRYRARAIAKHVGILAVAEMGGGAGSPLRHAPSASSLSASNHIRLGAHGTADDGRFTLIHAAEGVPITEVPLGPWWRRRIAAAFSFPGMID